VLFGAYDPELDVCICFYDQVGAHGAMGGRQSWPFILTRPGLVPDDYVIDDPMDLHPLFRRYTRDVGMPRPDAPAATPTGAGEADVRLASRPGTAGRP
jgi:hypothetical protein